MKAYLPELKLVYKTREDIVKEKIKHSGDCATILRKMFDSDTIEYSEEVILLLLNRNNETIGFLKISSGGLDNCVIDTRMIFATALKAGANAIIVSHNHPSGNLKPSDPDLKITRKLVEASKILDIGFLDHIIITKTSHFSFSDNNLI